MKIELEVEIPEGYEVEKFRLPKGGELYLDKGRVREAQFDFSAHECIILRKKKHGAFVYVPDKDGNYCSNDGIQFELCIVWVCDRPRYRREEREEAQ